MNALNYFCRIFSTVLWVSGGGLCGVKEYFGWVGLDRQFLWVCVDRWRCISSGWEWVDILFEWMGVSGGEWRYILVGLRW